MKKDIAETKQKEVRNDAYDVQHDFDLNKYPKDEYEPSSQDVSHQVVHMMWKNYFSKFICCLRS